MTAVTVAVDVGAADQLHYEIRSSGLRRPGIQYLGDVGMLHQRERLSLGLELRDDAAGVHARLHHLERDLSPDRLLLLRQKNDAAPALTDFLDQLVVSDAISRFLGYR